MRSSRLFFYTIVTKFLPATRFFSLKRVLLRWCGAKIGQNVRIVSSARFSLAGRLSIGDNSWIGHEVLIVGGSADVSIGAEVDVAPRVMIVTGSHELFTNSVRAAGTGFSRPVIIGDGAWLGASSVILGGVVIGRGGMVAAGAVVNSEVAAGCVVGGVPARTLRSSKWVAK